MTISSEPNAGTTGIPDAPTGLRTDAQFAILVVAYRTAEKLQICLNSIKDYLPQHPVYIWDNSGPDYDDVRRLAESKPEFHWHLGGPNIGFAAAVNQLAARAEPLDFLLLNPDAELLSPLTETLAALRQDGVAAAGPIGEHPEDSRPGVKRGHELRPWDSARRRRTFLNSIGGAASCDRRLRGTPLSQLYKYKPRYVDGYVTGACLAIRRDAWETIGPFDEEFFLYGEESDWQRRATAAGWRIALSNETGYRHTAGGTVSDDLSASIRSQDLLRSNYALSLEYQYGTLAAEVYLAFTAVIEALRTAVGRSALRPTKILADIVIPVNVFEEAATAERIKTANALQSAGYTVALITVGRLGSLPAVVPTSIRLLRWPCWWPLSTNRASATLLVPTERSIRETVLILVSRLFRRAKCAPDAQPGIK